jgi:AraC-like DNA-binding protein
VFRASGKAEVVRDQRCVDVSDTRDWARADKFDAWARLCCQKPHLNLVSDPETFSLTQRLGRVGPVRVCEVIVGSDTSLECTEMCSSYRVLLPMSGQMDWIHKGASVSAGLGSVYVAAPDGLSATRWAAGTTMVSFMIDGCAVDDALCDALGRQVTPKLAFTPVMPAKAAETRSLINMVLLFKEQMFQANSLLDQPLVGLPFAESLVRAFLLAADHSYRAALTGDEQLPAPRTVRLAIEIIEAEAHLPLTVSSIAARCHVSVRALQQGFRRYMGSSPTAYLREVRLRRAHQSLLASDPSETSVASVARCWGFTNLGRFAAAHTARYDEPPAATLRRRTFARLERLRQ